MSEKLLQAMIMQENDLEIIRLRILTDPVPVIKKIRLEELDKITKAFRNEGQVMPMGLADAVYSQVVEMMHTNAEKLAPSIEIDNQDMETLLGCILSENDCTTAANEILKRLFEEAGFSEEEIEVSSYLGNKKI